jgi:hypothetical protein
MKLHRAQLTVITIVAAAIVIPGAVAAAQQTARPAAAQDVLWEGDPAKGTGVFQALERSPGTVTVANDPKGQFGPSFRFETWENGGTKSRCESRGVKGVDLDSSQLNKTFYVGWRALLDPMPITKGRWISFWQLHWSGAGPGGGPLTVRTLGDGNIHFQYVSPDGKVDRNIWSGPLPLGRWFTVVVAFRLAKDGTATGVLVRRQAGDLRQRRHPVQRADLQGHPRQPQVGRLPVRSQQGPRRPVHQRREARHHLRSRAPLTGQWRAVQKRPAIGTARVAAQAAVLHETPRTRCRPGSP